MGKVLKLPIKEEGGRGECEEQNFKVKSASFPRDNLPFFCHFGWADKLYKALSDDFIHQIIQLLERGLWGRFMLSIKTYAAASKLTEIWVM
jgi:hypothetical protein